MKTELFKNSICLFSEQPVFNVNSVANIGYLSREDTVYLNSLLMMINFENADGSDVDLNKAIYLSNDDIDFVPKQFISEEYNLITADGIKRKENLENLSSVFFDRYENNLLLRSDVIGLSSKMFNTIFNLLSGDDDILIIGKSLANRVAFLGFNSVNTKTLKALISNSNSYEDLLKEINKNDVFIHTLNGFKVINTFDDFKDLYYELSKKESLSYCSEQMHERFTNLFIEYKDYLK